MTDYPTVSEHNYAFHLDSCFSPPDEYESNTNSSCVSISGPTPGNKYLFLQLFQVLDVLILLASCQLQLLFLCRGCVVGFAELLCPESIINVQLSQKYIC